MSSYFKVIDIIIIVYIVIINIAIISQVELKSSIMNYYICDEKIFKSTINLPINY